MKSHPNAWIAQSFWIWTPCLWIRRLSMRGHRLKFSRDLDILRNLSTLLTIQAAIITLLVTTNSMSPNKSIGMNIFSQLIWKNSSVNFNDNKRNKIRVRCIWIMDSLWLVVSGRTRDISSKSVFKIVAGTFWITLKMLGTIRRAWLLVKANRSVGRHHWQTMKLNKRQNFHVNNFTRASYSKATRLSLHPITSQEISSLKRKIHKACWWLISNVTTMKKTKKFHQTF